MNSSKCFFFKPNGSKANFVKANLLIDPSSFKIKFQTSIMAERANTQQTPQQFLEIAAEISQCNYNVRQFKKTHHNKHLKAKNPHQTISRLNTEPNQISNPNADASFSSLRPKTQADGLNKTLRFNSTFIPPQNSKNKKAFFSKSMSGGEGFGRYRSEQKSMKTKEISNLQKYEQKWSKQKLNERYLQGWLNSILIEFCHNQYFDHKIANCALKKLGIDENSLVAKGLKASNVGRLYRSLFVFGMGFNELTKELSNGSVEVGKIIWKIYSIVLQYCSKGNLETVIGEIQRENELKVTELAGELQRKQEIIEKNEELNERRNNQIYKEIKSLRQENVNLKNQKTVLLDQYSATEQAFGQEINLRLKFETKINQIYGLHRQLGLKHEKLYNQFVKKIEQLKKESEKYFQAVSKISEYKQITMNIREQLVQKKEKVQRYAQNLQQANKEIMSLSTKICNLQYEIDSLKSLYKEIKVKQKQWLIEKSNMEVIVDMRQKSAKETFKQYQITLEENNRLYIMISDQRKTMEDYEKEKKNFNSKIISIVAENSFNKRKLEETTKKYEEMQINFNKLSEDLIKSKEDNEILAKNQSSYKSHFDVVQARIQEMHKLNIAQSDQLTNLRIFQQGCDKVIAQKNSSLQNLRKDLQKTNKAFQQLKVKCHDLQSKNTILGEKLSKIETQLQLKQAKLVSIFDQNQQKSQQLVKTCAEQSIQLQKTKGHYEVILRQYKNQKFQRNSLNTMYTQALRTLQSKNNEQRSLRVNLSLMEGELSKARNNYTVLQSNMLKLIANFSQLQEKLEQTLQKQRQAIYERQQYTHPMLVQDMRTHLFDLEVVKEQNQRQLQLLKINLQKERAFGKQEMEKASSSFRWQLNKMKVESQRVIQALKNELTYVNEQWTKQKKKVEQLQEVAESYRKKIFQKTTSQREQIYKYMMQQKSRQIQKMFKEMQVLQDELTSSKRMLAEAAISKDQEMMNSQDQLKSIIQESIRKELSHQFDLKIREAQRTMKSEYLKKQSQIKTDIENSIKDMSVQQLLKIKNISPEQLKGIVTTGRYQRQFYDFDSKESQERSQDKIRQKGQNHQQVRNRSQIGRLMKNAYQYYQP